MRDDDVHLIKDLIDEYSASLPKLAIAILGPGENNPNDYARKCYGKRCQIKEKLAEVHTVWFFEEICDEAERRNVTLSNTLAFEQIVSFSNKVNIVLALFVLDAPGLQAELVAFSNAQGLAEKMYVYYDSTYYSRGETRYWMVNNALDLVDGGGGKIWPFTEAEVDDCTLLAKIVQAIERRRHALCLLTYRKYREAE